MCYHLDLENHARLVLLFGGIFLSNFSVGCGAHETKVDAATDVILVWFPELIGQDATLVASEDALRWLHS